MERRVYHILQNGLNGWKSMLEQSGRASVTGANKQDVINRTIAIAKSYSKCSVVIHKVDGSIQEERTFPRSASPV
ncbi:MAG: hypothetical protein DI539_03025 [Flavobacterium psychrophilum]|nr:MAG: hypothetical protein DI539_03025 [Flavobacterium psychrophilum]